MGENIMKEKLLKVAKYLGQNGFYKEAANLKKLAEDDNEPSHKYIVVYKDGAAQEEIKEAARRKGFTVTFTEPDDDKMIDLDPEDEAKKYDLVTVSHPANLITDETDTMTFIEKLDSVFNVIAVD
jgi:uroporphyrinogen-III synthase